MLFWWKLEMQSHLVLPDNFYELLKNKIDKTIDKFSWILKNNG